MRATLIVISPLPVKTGLAIVPRTSTSSAVSPSSSSTPGMNCRMKFTELRGNRIFAFSWRFVRQLSLLRDFWSIERKIRNQLQRLNFGLLQFSGDRQAPCLCACAVKSHLGGLELWEILAPQIAHLDVEPRV